MNKVILIGRLTKDPEVKNTAAQVSVCRFTIAVDRKFKDSNGQRQADFINCVAWRQTAEFVSKYFQKGSMAVVAGRLQLRDWVDKEGNKRRNAEVVVENVYFGESKRRDGDSSGNFSSPYSNDYSSQSAPSIAHNEFEELSEDDGELPF